MNEFFDHWVKKLLWLWLPFYALFHLMEEFIEQRKTEAQDGHSPHTIHYN